MKITYEEDDIQSGMYLIRNSKSKEIDYSFDMTNLYKVGYQDKEKDKRKKDGYNYYCLISMTDGWIQKFNSKKELVEHLNKDENGYLIISYEKLIKLLKNYYIEHIKENLYVKKLVIK